MGKFWDITNLNELNFNSPNLGDLKKVLSKN